MKKPTCTFSYGGLRHTMCTSFFFFVCFFLFCFFCFFLFFLLLFCFFHSYLKETKKINNQFLNKHSIKT